MSTNGNFRKSPVGEILFMAANNPVKKSKSSEEQVYTVKLAFDLKKDKKWLDEVSELNDTKVVTEKTYRGKDSRVKEVLAQGKAIISASSKYKPEVYNSAGEEMEEAPMFFADSKGTAQMIVQPYKGDKGGTITLAGIKIHSIESPMTNTMDRETRLQQLRAAAQENAGN